MEDLFELLYERLERLGVPLDRVDEDVFCIIPSLGNAVGQIRVDIASDSGDEFRVEFIDYKRQCLQNGFLEVAVNQGIDTLEDLIVFCDENVSSYDEMVYSPLKTGDIGRIAHELRDLSAQMEEDFVTLSKALSSSVEESAHGRRGRKHRTVEKIHGVNERDNEEDVMRSRIIRNRGRRYEAEEHTFPDKVLIKVKGQIVELTEDGWDQQEIVQMLQDMGISFTRAYGYGFYCADKRCYRFLCQALKKDDKAQKAIDAGKPITKASLIKGLDFVAYAMNQALKKGDALVKVGESRRRRFEELTVEDDVVEISLEDIINDSCQMIYGSYDVSYQLDSDLTRWTYTIETDSGAKDNRTFTLDVQESGLSGRATAVYEVELGEIVDGDFESIEDEEFRCTWSGDWEDDMGSLCSDIVNWALGLIDKEVGR